MNGRNMAGTASGATSRHIDYPVVPSDPGAWFPTPCTKDDRSADALLEWIEDGDVDARFVPDWSDDSVKNAA
jgi:hypothetical protein